MRFLKKQNDRLCPKCGMGQKYYDSVERIVRTSYGRANKVQVQRYKCLECGYIHRELPKYLISYKHYTNEIRNGVISGKITPETLGYEDYPCEMTMKRWIYSA